MNPAIFICYLFIPIAIIARNLRKNEENIEKEKKQDV